MLPADDMIRPLFVAPFGALGGQEIVLLRLARSMEDRFDPRALVMTNGPLVQRLSEAGIPTDVEELQGKQGVLHFRSASRSVAARLRAEGISLVHANGIKAALFGIPLAKQLGVPLVWMKHDHVLDGWPTRLIGARCDRVVCVNSKMASQFPSKMQDRVSVIYPGVEQATAPSAAETEPLIVCAGRLDPAKGFGRLLHAVALLRDRGQNVRIAIAGSADRIFPEHQQELEELIDELQLRDRAKLLGWVDDLSDLYSSARVAVVATGPRRRGRPGEGAGLVLIEAMSYGTPVVAARGAGTEEVVGDAGTMVDELTPNAFAEALEPYLSDPTHAAEVGRRGRERFERKFTLDRMVADLSEIYRELVT